jgi:hypothetical protein
MEGLPSSEVAATVEFQNWSMVLPVKESHLLLSLRI